MLEPVDTSPYATWQAYVSIWDWTTDVDWDETAAHYQDWEGSQEWTSQSSWLATVLPRSNSIQDILNRVSGLLCRASGQGSEHLQPLVEDVTGHSFLSTKAVGDIDLAVNPTYAILDLGCTKSMGSRCWCSEQNHGSSSYLRFVL